MDWLVVWNIVFLSIYWKEWSQLTNSIIFQRARAQPPTSGASIHCSPRTSPDVTAVRQENRGLRHSVLWSSRGLCHWCVGLPGKPGGVARCASRSSRLLRPDIHHLYIDIHKLYKYVYIGYTIYIYIIYLCVWKKCIYIMYRNLFIPLNRSISQL